MSFVFSLVGVGLPSADATEITTGSSFPAVLFLSDKMLVVCFIKLYLTFLSLSTILCAIALVDRSVVVGSNLLDGDSETCKGDIRLEAAPKLWVDQNILKWESYAGRHLSQSSV